METISEALANEALPNLTDEHRDMKKVQNCRSDDSFRSLSLSSKDILIGEREDNSDQFDLCDFMIEDSDVEISHEDGYCHGDSFTGWHLPVRRLVAASQPSDMRRRK